MFHSPDALLSVTIAPSPYGASLMDEGNLDRFQAVLRRESRLKTGEPIPSSTPAQASLVLETFFASANSAIRVVTGRLNARVYGRDHVIIEAKKFLADRSRSLEIIFLSEMRPRIVDVHPLLSSLKHNDNIHLFQAPPGSENNLSFHFAIMDDDSYRFKKDAGSHGSITAFGDPEFAAKLLRVFAFLRAKSREIRVETAQLV
jgi:hypothetical protein